MVLHPLTNSFTSQVPNSWFQNQTHMASQMMKQSSQHHFSSLIVPVLPPCPRSSSCSNSCTQILNDNSSPSAEQPKFYRDRDRHIYSTFVRLLGTNCDRLVNPLAVRSIAYDSVNGLHKHVADFQLLAQDGSCNEKSLHEQFKEETADEIWDELIYQSTRLCINKSLLGEIYGRHKLQQSTGDGRKYCYSLLYTTYSPQDANATGNQQNSTLFLGKAVSMH